jgi:M6 family metalloprotease-like protein
MRLAVAAPMDEGPAKTRISVASGPARISPGKASMRSKTRVLFAIFVSFFLTVTAASAQAPGDEIRNLNGQILRLQADVDKAAPGVQAMLRAQATPLLARRAQLLETLTRQDPAEALRVGFPPEVLARLAAAFPQSVSLLEVRGVWRGPIEYLIVDDATLSRHESIVRLAVNGRPRRVRFAAGEPPDLKSGDLLRLEGLLAGGELAAATSAVEATALTCSTLGVQRSVVLLVTFPGVAPPSAVTPQAIYDIFFAPSGRSLDGYWREVSSGKASASGDVFGWFTLDKLYDCSDYYNLRDAAIRAADPYVDFRNYTRVFIVFPVSSCSYAGLATVSCTSLSAPGDGAFSASVAWLVANYMGTRDTGVKLVAHEAGHNLGLSHAASRDFGAEALGPLGVQGTLSEYGDVFSAMGSWNFGHYAAPHKLKLGWYASGAQVADVETSGSFSLQPAEITPAGLQALRIRRGTGNNAWLWLEYRRPLGAYDSTLPSQVFSGALIHYQDSLTGNKTHLLDFTPETSSWSDPALATGRSWTDPYSDVSIRVESATSSALTVSVNYGTAPCVRSNPSLSMSPAIASVYPGSSAGYQVTLANRDTGACPSSVFTLASGEPAGWGTGFSASTVTLAPGQSATVTLTKTAPAAAPLGTYTVAVSASDGLRSVAASASCSVVAPPPPLAAALSLGQSTYALKSTVPITVTVTSGASPAAGATVVFRLVRPNGSVANQTLTTGSNGQAVWNFKPQQKGTHTVSAAATYNGQSATAAPVQFTVN